MNEPQNPQLERSPHEELVAYLDGELDEAGRRRVEQRLATDESVRAALAELQRAWDLLDDLPAGDVSDSFTRSTLEMAVVSAEAEAEQAVTETRRNRWLWVTVTAAGVLLGGIIGYAAVSRVTTRAHRQLARDLPVLEQLSVYRHVGGVGFLRQLEEADLFNDAFAETEGGATLVSLRLGETLEQREARLGTLEAREKLDLEQNTKQFLALPESQQESIRDTYAELSKRPDAEQLAAVATQYHEWLMLLPATQRAELLDLEPAARLSEIQSILKKQEEERIREWMQTPLSPEDVSTLFAWLDEYTRRHMTPELEDSLLEKMPSDVRRRLREAEPVERRRMLVGAIFRFRIGSQLPMPIDEDFAVLARGISEKPRSALLQSPNEQAKLLLVQSWMRMAFFSKYLPTITEEDLNEFFRTKIDATTRAELESLPAEEMQQELRKLYISNHLREMQRPGGGSGGRSWGSPWSWGGPGPGPGGPRFEGPRGDGQRGDGRPDHRPGEGRSEDDGPDFRGPDRGPGERGPGERGSGDRNDSGGRGRDRD